MRDFTDAFPYAYTRTMGAGGLAISTNMLHMNLVFASGVLVPQHLLGRDYFSGIRDVFPDALFPDVPLTAGVDARADAMAAQIDATFPAGPIHVIAHSMGGLDARSLLSRNLRGLAAPGRIASLSTISSPHRGSPIADLLVGANPDGPGPRQSAYAALRYTFDKFGVPLEALGELTSGSTAAFNRTHANVAHVRYLSYAGDRVDSFVLIPVHRYIESVGQSDEERMNDGIVSVASANWGEVITPRWPTDHLGELGHSLNPLPTPHSSFDHIAATRDLVARVSAS